MPGSDIIRLPNGKTVTLSRALALGWVVLVADGEPILTAKAPANSQDDKAARRAEQVAAWRRSQGLEAEPEVTTDGKPKGRKKVEPLRPQNVTAEGEPVTDEETLAKIAAEAAAAEAARQEQGS